jgi:hypothetical protein
MKALRRIALSFVLGVLLAAVTAKAAADGRGYCQPRVAEVNARLGQQERRINEALREGEISPRRAARLHREGRAILREEARMTYRNGGYLTRREQWRLNAQENIVNAQIAR